MIEWGTVPGVAPMYLLELTCAHFRSLELLRFRPSPGVNVLRGLNAQGKTSVLEALFYLATSKSHRTNNESELAQHGEETFDVHARVRRADREVDIQVRYWQGAKRLFVNGVAQERVSDLLGRINAVLFSPEDIGLVKGSAAHRRRFMDMELSQLNPTYLGALQQYRQVLRQRNELLRAPRPDGAVLGAWEGQLARYGSVLIAERERFLGELAEAAALAYAHIAGGEPLQVLYRPDIAEPDALTETFERTREADLRHRATTRGPHRDDFELRVADQPARTYASQGQQKTAALALRLAEVTLVHARLGEYPILMLDDVVSELDAERGRRLRGAVDPEVQCIVTTTDLSDGVAAFGADSAQFEIEGGRLARR
jgi:DNA replication and repair protein RecF